jgi:long-chain acyl-CoA synthetase
VQAEKAAKIEMSGGKPGGLAWTVAQKLVFSKLQTKLAARFGGRLRFFVSGGAPLGKDLAYFFKYAGVEICEGFGLTETSAASAVNLPGQVRIGTVGRPIPGTEFKVAADGELLIRGRGVMTGYYNRPDATAEVFDEERWFKTGDIGVIDGDGYIRITDRKKDIIVTAGGKNVAPQNLERMLKGIAGVSQAVVIGDRQPYLVALFTLDPERPASAQALQRGVDAVNAHLAQYETIKRFVVLPGDFSVEGGELTPTQKVKRKAVSEKYAAEITALYDAGQ